MWTIQDPDLEKLLSLLAHKEEFVFLDTSRPDHENGESLLFLDPVDRLICRADESLEQYLDDLQESLAKGYYLAGWVGYEFGAMLESRIRGEVSHPPDKQTVLADLGVFSQPYTFDHYSGKNNFPFSSQCTMEQKTCTISELRPNMAKEEFLAVLDQVRRYIIAGDTYQVNYTMKLLFDFAGSPEKLYSILRRNQSVAYSGYLRNGEERILSFSPELFFRKKGDEITVRPMKGTAAKGRNSLEEQRIGSELQNDIKNRSENVMIVDLLRNDLARLMHGHGESRVFVDSLFDIESYESLLQMTSTIKAKSIQKTMSELKLTELFRALFPCGSITGAPKIRTMQIIDELEKERRGVYTGAIGYFSPDGSAVFNVPIRTVRLQGSSGEMGIGAGITYDSIAEDEWEESLLKGRFLTHSQVDFSLFETILWQPDTGYWLLEKHLSRLAGGALFFKFSCNVEVVRSQLSREEAGFTEGCYRVRLVLAKDGRTTLSTLACAAPLLTQLSISPFPAEVSDCPLIDFSPHQVDAKSPWLYYKTTMRGLYDAEYAEAQKNGLFDYIFCNSAGEVTEGCISNIIIFRQGIYMTPPVASGLLPGVMRKHIMEDGTVPVVEKILTRQDIISAEAIFVCNSVRGLVRVKLKNF